jgi:hypothetical protein
MIKKIDSLKTDYFGVVIYFNFEAIRSFNSHRDNHLDTELRMSHPIHSPVIVLPRPILMTFLDIIAIRWPISAGVISGDRSPDREVYNRPEWFKGN